MTSSSGTCSCRTLIMHCASLSLWNLLFAKTVLCKWLFSVYNWGWSLHQGSQLWLLWPFGQENPYLENRVAALVRCSLFGSILGPGTPDAINILVVTGKITSGHCQMQSKINPTWHLRTTALHGTYFLVL